METALTGIQIAYVSGLALGIFLLAVIAVGVYRR